MASDLHEAAGESGNGPYLALNMVATTDGRITVGGRSGPIGGDADRELFHELRANVDAVMVGAATANVERYGRLVRDEDRRRRRAEAGLASDPLAVIVSARLSLAADVPLLQDPDSTVVIITQSDQELEGCRAKVRYLRPEDVDTPSEADSAGTPSLALAPMLRRLAKDGIGTILCEGGSMLNHALLGERLVDELFLCLAPKLAAGTGPTIVSGPPLDPPLEMSLLAAHEADGDLFLRYRLRK